MEGNGSPYTSHNMGLELGRDSCIVRRKKTQILLLATTMLMPKKMMVPVTIHFVLGVSIVLRVIII